MEGMSHPHVVFSKVANSILAQVAAQMRVVLGDGGEEIDRCIDQLKAREIAQAKNLEAKEKVDKRPMEEVVVEEVSDDEDDDDDNDNEHHIRIIESLLEENLITYPEVALRGNPDARKAGVVTVSS